MSETKSYNVLTTENGVPIKAWTKGVSLEDQACKPIEAVMAAQSDLVEIVHTLRQVVCVKG